MESIKKSRYQIINIVFVISYLVLFLSFKSSNQWSTFGIGNELTWWIVQIVFLYLLIKCKNIFSSPFIENNLFYVKIYLLWNLICVIRGAILFENYWELKNLFQVSFLLFLPLIVYLSNSFNAIQIIFQTWFKYGLIVFALFSPFIKYDGVGKFLMPISILLLFFPVLNTKTKIILGLFTFYIFIADVTAKSNIIKFLVPFSISFLIYFKDFINKKILNFFRFSFLLLPLILVFLGIIGIFNVFKLDEYIGEQSIKTDVNGEKGEQNLLQDTRTFLYQEVIESAIKNNYVFFGRTPARGNDSFSFGDYNKETLKTGKAERFSNEVSILNIFTWLGMVGVILYFFIFLRSSYLAINESNNFFIKLIGLYISFRWAYGFVEDFSNFDLSNIFLWILIGMCFSKTFRKINNVQMINWIRGIFEKKIQKPLIIDI